MTKAVKVRIYPTSEQGKVLKLWAHTSRYVYNKALAQVVVKKEKLNAFNIRNDIVTEDWTAHNNFIEKLLDDLDFCSPEVAEEISSRYRKPLELTPWERNTPKSIREPAVFRMSDAYKTNMNMFREGKLQFFKMHFKRKREERELMFAINNKNSCRIENGYFKMFSDKKWSTQLGWVPEVEMSARDKSRVAKLQAAANDSASVAFKDGKWWFIFTHDVLRKSKEIKKFDATKAVAVDPGIRAFATCYTPHKIVTFQQPRAEIRKLYIQVDRLKRKLTPECKVRNLRRALLKREQRIANLIRETHLKTIRHLVDNYDHIFVGDIQVQKIVRDRRLCKSTKREFYTLAFHSFKLRLKTKAEELGKVVVYINEAYTSKTCTFCGGQYNVGSAKRYRCPTCTASYDRDEGAARNIFLKTVISASQK
jgi:IS605 OrfB family transposase